MRDQRTRLLEAFNDALHDFADHEEVSDDTATLALMDAITDAPHILGALRNLRKKAMGEDA